MISSHGDEINFSKANFLTPPAPSTRESPTRLDSHEVGGVRVRPPPSFSLSRSVSRNEATGGERTLWCVCVCVCCGGGTVGGSCQNNNQATSLRIMTWDLQRRTNLLADVSLRAVSTLAPGVAYDWCSGTSNWWAEKRKAHFFKQKTRFPWLWKSAPLWCHKGHVSTLCLSSFHLRHLMSEGPPKRHV